MKWICHASPVHALLSYFPREGPKRRHSTKLSQARKAPSSFNSYMVSLLCSPGVKIGDAVIEDGLPDFSGDKGMSVYQRSDGSTCQRHSRHICCKWRNGEPEISNTPKQLSDEWMDQCARYFFKDALKKQDRKHTLMLCH